MSSHSADVVVLGAGLTGASAGWHLAQAGLDVAVLEQFQLGHDAGSSHGSSRIFRRAYADPFYVGLTGMAEPLWEQLEAESGRRLRTFTGGIDSGSMRDPEHLLYVLRQAGADGELLAPQDVAERWPGMRVDEQVMFHPHAGWMNSDATVAALIDVAQRHGAQLHQGVTAERVETADGKIRVHTSSGESWRADRLVLAMGGWIVERAAGFLRELGLKPAIPPITVRQQEVFHFRQYHPQVQYPAVVHKGDQGEFYTLASGSDGGPAPAMKIGQFNSTFPTTASARDKVIDPRARADVQAYARSHFPGLEPDPVAEMSCLFTMTSDQDFLIDTAGPVTIASPCSGHGAKFAPLIGRQIADSLFGRPLPQRLRFRH